MDSTLKILSNKKKARAIAQYSSEYLLNMSIKSRELIGNDFDATVVLFTIQVYVGERAFRLNERNVRNMSFEDNFPEELLLPISRLAIANITGLPKETVRRKIIRLERLGLIRKVGTRGVAMSHEFALGPGRAALVQSNHKALLKMFTQIAALENDPETP